MASPFSNAIVGGDNVFEINDFTVVTEFEVLTLTLENAIQEIKTEAELQGIEQNENSSKKGILSRKFAFQNYEFQIDYYRQSDNNMAKVAEDYAEKHSYLNESALALNNSNFDFFEEMVVSKQYGILSDFFLLYTIGPNNFMTESTVNIVQSAVNLASLNTDCDFPILFQFARGASVGVLQNRNFMTNFEGAVLNNCLPSQKYLDGVIKMFKEKINALFAIDERIKTSLQHDFHTKLGPSSENRSTSAGSSSSELRRQRNASSGCRCPHKYPFQPIGLSLVQRLTMAAVWVDIDEHLLVETENFTNIDPESAQRWKCSVQFDEEFSFEQTYLFTRLFELAEEEFAECSIRSQLLPSSDSSSSLGTTALGPLIGKPMIRNINFVEESPLNSESDLSDCVNFILKENLNDNEGPKAEEQFTEAQQRMFQKFSNLKSVPLNSFARRLAVCLVEKIDGNFVDFCRLWTKFLQILRHHWEYNLNLPNFDTDERPQLSCCLLHQKLQMINYCISVKKRKHKEMEANETENLGGSAKDLPANRNTADDEFFDAIESFDQFDVATSSECPRGRSHPLDSNEYLKGNPNQRIFVPFTQEEGPMTEDQIERRESFLCNLEDANLRTKAQSELLLSDMQAFKAANPGCELVDFLRWHSPRDLTEEGELSDRMKIAGNFWQETWDSARAIPATQQQRLFNETREVEQILQYFANISIKELVELLLPIVSVHMAEILLKNAAECWDLVEPKFEKLFKDLNVATKTGDMDAYFDVSHSLHTVEEMLIKYSTTINLILGQAHSADLLKHIELNVLKNFVANLCHPSNVLLDELSPPNVQFSCEIPDAPYGPIFGVLRNFFVTDEDAERAEEEKEWPKPTRKQMILRSFLPHPGNGSRAMPQRMYVSYRDGEFVFCGIVDNLPNTLIRNGSLSIRVDNEQKGNGRGTADHHHRIACGGTDCPRYYHLLDPTTSPKKEAPQWKSQTQPMPKECARDD
ncbi:hypothetical protein niasHT_013564 [Heterodera trifolii]|uniref:Rab3 GTPase-activating protein catalytic subunit n=1 Tax=Heterodera trifolii TaxID=157864 RepID=A0ABD2LGG1_9BILA